MMGLRSRNYELRNGDTSSFWILTSSFLRRRVPPGECGFTSSDGNPGTNGVISKTRGGAWNKEDSADFASAFGRARPPGAPSLADGPAVRPYHYFSTTSSGNSVDVDLFGKCAANAAPTSPIASTSASENLSLRKCSRIRSTTRCQ